MSQRLTPPSLEMHVALYSEMPAPPLLAGGENATEMACSPGVTDVIVGAPGRSGSTSTDAEGADGGPKPTRFLAATTHE